jgi:hypothetical protein
VLALLLAVSCSWYERRQACSAATREALAAWVTAQPDIRAAAERAAEAAKGLGEQAGTTQAALAGAEALRDAPKADAAARAAQDAFTSARALGGAEAAARAQWAQYAEQTRSAALEADQEGAVAEAAAAVVRAWTEVESTWRVAAGLARAARLARAYTDAERDTPRPELLLEALPPLPASALPAPLPAGDAPEAPEMQFAADLARQAAEAHDEADRASEVAGGLAERSVRAAQVADAAARAFEFHKFPPEAGIALSASNEARVSGQRARQAGRLVDEARTAMITARGSSPDLPEAVLRAVDAARQKDAARDEVCD